LQWVYFVDTRPLVWLYVIFIKPAKNEAWERVCANVDSKLGFKRSAEAWTALKCVRKESRHMANLQLIQMCEWMSYFQKLLSEDRGDFSEDEGGAQ
jgi:hypothetical protein